MLFIQIKCSLLTLCSLDSSIYPQCLITSRYYFSRYVDSTKQQFGILGTFSLTVLTDMPLSINLSLHFMRSSFNASFVIHVYFAWFD